MDFRRRSVILAFSVVQAMSASTIGFGSLYRHTCQRTSLPLAFGMKRQLSCAAMTLKKALSEWSFSEPKLSTLPLDPETENYVRRHVPNAVFSVARPTPLKTERKIAAKSDDTLRLILDMDPSISSDPDFVDFVSGNLVLPGSTPMAHRYGGHQFGSWAAQLGDGRAHLLGEYVNAKGEHWELQLKGSGPTPYSRFADGRAVVRSSVREFLCSEAMHNLGVPTSRAATLIISDDPIPRDQFYNGNVKMERGAVVLRLAPTWFRFGSFEILAYSGELDTLRTLAEFVLKEHFSHIEGESLDEKLLGMLAQILEETATMIAHWMSVGFTHGVMNTDNMSIMSVTIDYGPFGFIDEYDPNFIPNTSDDMGRYDLESQPRVGLWNLAKLAQALSPLIPKEKHGRLTSILEDYGGIYKRKMLELFRAKLGLTTEKDGDHDLVAKFLDLMQTQNADFTQTFRDLSELSLEDLNREIPESSWGLAKLARAEGDFSSLVSDYTERIKGEEDFNDEGRMERMQRVNPRYILRNWIAQRAIEKAEADDFSEVQKVLRVLQRPFEAQKEAEEAGYAGPVPHWSKRLKVSCSS